MASFWGEIVRQPLDMWNLIGGVLGIMVGIVSMFAFRHAEQQAMMHLRETRASQEEIEAWQKRRNRIKAILLIMGFVVLPLAGFFLLGPVYRAKLGG